MLRSLLSALLLISAAAAAQGQVTGKVTLSGTIPVMKSIDMSGVRECAACHPEPIKEELIVASASGELKNVIVSLKTAAGLKIPLPLPTEPGILTQRGCQYFPHVLPVMLGQTVIVKNDDPFLHNVHGVTDLNDPPFLTQPTKDAGQKLPPFTAVETFKIKCDVHLWMAAWIRILDNPYFATTGDDGTYEIKGLPDGAYTLTAWQEQLGEIDQPITVKAGRATADFQFKSDAGKQP